MYSNKEDCWHSTEFSLTPFTLQRDFSGYQLASRVLPSQRDHLILLHTQNSKECLTPLRTHGQN